MNERRRDLLGIASATMTVGSAHAASRGLGSATFGRAKQIRAGQLDVGYFEFGSRGAPVLLLHGFPYDVHSYVDVAPMLAAKGCRVIVPHLRGHGTTRFVDSAEPRAGQQGSIGADAFIECYAPAPEQLPLAVCPNGEVLRNPTEPIIRQED